jgi:hypothetical protein
MNKELLINVFIAGAQKAGTSSLKYYLGQHPNVSTHPQLEMTFFFKDEEFEMGGNYLKENYDLNPKSPIVLVKHATMARSELALSRLAKHNPNCKIIYLTREPLSRAFSSYSMEKKNGVISENFEDVLKIAFSDQNHWYWNVLVRLGFYAEQLERIRLFFPKKNILVLRLEDIQRNPEHSLNTVYEFLGVPQCSVNLEKRNTADEPSLSRITKVVSQFPVLKNAILKTVGYERSSLLAKKLNFSKKRKESLSDYDDSSEVLKLQNTYGKWNEKLKKDWNVEY